MGGEIKEKRKKKKKKMGKGFSSSQLQQCSDHSHPFDL